MVKAPDAATERAAAKPTLLTKRNIFSSLELGFLLPATIIGLTLENVEDVEKVPQEPQGLTAEKGFGGRRHDRI
jgi:hypothetical protein